MNKTKIIATVGPASKDKETLKQLILAGIDVIRLNMSHASHAFCTDIIDKIRQLNKELNTHIAIMLDTKGPSIRIGKFIGGRATLQKGTKIRIYMDEIIGDNTKFSVNYPGLLADVKYNTIIKINDGLLEVIVLEKGPSYLICEVTVGGKIYDHKSLNVPGVRTTMPFLSKEDINDINYAASTAVDFLALSFVSSQEDVLEVNDKLIELNNDHIVLIAKIENEDAVANLDSIISVSNGAMVARGDLSVEMPMERVPSIQKQIIHKCHMMGKISIVATEMMSSMQLASRPTRAEVSDIANAVLDGTDAVMLSGETTIGKYPIETVEMMEKIITRAEEDINHLECIDMTMRTEKTDITGMIAFSVVESAYRLKCKAIIAPTISGNTARYLSRFRPSCPIIAASPNESTILALALHFGVKGVLVNELNSFDKIINVAENIAKKTIKTVPGDKIIITGGYPFNTVKHTNFMKIQEL